MPSSIESLKFKSLSFEYSNEDQILNECSIEFPMDTVVGIGGDYGCGKSTILKMLAGLLEPTAGEYWINDSMVNDMSFEELIPFRLRMGYAFDYGGLLNNKTLEENLKLPLQYHNVLPANDINSLVGGLMKRFGLEGVANHRPSSVSGSQRKITCVIRAFVLNPEILILDNPTYGLSEEATDQFFNEIESRRSVGQLRHVFVVSNDKRVKEEMVEKTIIVENRQLKDKDEKKIHERSA